MNEKLFDLMEKMYVEFSKRFDTVEKKVGENSNHILRLENELKENSKTLFDGYKQTYEGLMEVKTIKSKVSLL